MNQADAAPSKPTSSTAAQGTSAARTRPKYSMVAHITSYAANAPKTGIIRIGINANAISLCHLYLLVLSLCLLWLILHNYYEFIYFILLFK